MKVRSAAARVDRHRMSVAAARTTLLSLATILFACVFTCATLNAAPIIAQEPPGTGNAPFLLVANPDMPDPVFQQTVILILPTATLPLVVGIVINKPTKMTLGQLFSHSPGIANRAQSVYFGGPVDLDSPLILMRAGLAPNATTHIFKDVFMSIDAGSISEILSRPESDKDLRVFLGRAQWSVNQLHAEILQGAWTTAPASPDLVFSGDPAAVWRTLEQQSKLREIEDDFGPSQQPFGSFTRGSTGIDAYGREGNEISAPHPCLQRFQSTENTPDRQRLRDEFENILFEE